MTQELSPYKKAECRIYEGDPSIFHNYLSGTVLTDSKGHDEGDAPDRMPVKLNIRE